MTEYLIINTLTSVWALLICRYIFTQAKYGFAVLLAALCCWLIPFGLLQFSTETVFVSQTSTWLNSIKQPVQFLVAQPEVYQFSWSHIILPLMTLGLLRFFWDCMQLNKQHNKFKLQGQTTGCANVFTITNLNNACVTGFKPSTIWVDEALYHSELNTSIITHEQQHIKQADPYWLVLISLIQRLFWFNPLVLLLAKQCKLTMELKCDEACQKQLPNHLYQNQMAQVLLVMQERKTAMTTFMAQSPKNHIQRIKNLSQETTMKKHHKWLLAISFTSITLLSAAVLANKTTTIQKSFPGIGDNQVYLEFKFTINEKEPKELSILVENGTEGSVKMDGYTFSFTPHIIEQSTPSIETKNVMVEENIKGDDKTQLLTEISVHQDMQTKTEVSSMSLMSLSNTWVSFEISETENNKAITAELRATTSNQPET